MRTKLLSVAVVVLLLSQAIGLVRASSLRTTELGVHILATCEVIEIRAFNQMDEPVRVTGEIWIQAEGGEAILLAKIPPQYQEVPKDGWGGAVDKIDSEFPGVFTGHVWGWLEVKTLDDVPLGRAELSKISMSCGSSTATDYVMYLPTALVKR